MHHQAISDSFPWASPIYESCLSNREQWKKLQDLVDMGLTWIDHAFIDKPVEKLVGNYTTRPCNVSIIKININ